jgi:F-type H+-transporting ATPase subunit alpha
VSVPAQLAVLLALAANLFDQVPLEKMTDAGHAVHQAAAKIPAEVCARLETADKLSDEDRKAMIEIARQALAPFQPKPKVQSEPDNKAGKKPEPPTAPGNKSALKPDKSASAAKSDTERKIETKPELTPADGATPNAATKAPSDSKGEPKAERGTQPKASVEAKPDSNPKPEAKEKGS